MELDRRLLLVHCAVHGLCVAAGLLLVVPMALNGSAFKGRCALFSSGHWSSGQAAGEEPRLVLHQWGPPAACQFATFVGIFTVLYGAAQCWRSLIYLHGRHDDNLFSSFLTVLLSVCVLFLSGGASIIMSLGFSSWCDVVTNDNTRPYSCADTQLVPLHLDVDTSSFYTDFSLAQASLWAVTSLWLAQFLLSFLRLYHSHSQHLTGPCLLREKEMLLGSSLSSSSSSSSPSPPPLTPTLLI